MKEKFKKFIAEHQNIWQLIKFTLIKLNCGDNRDNVVLIA